MLHKAVYWQLIVANPAERVQAPKAKKPKRRSYDTANYGLILIGYLYKLMANLCILLQLANGLLDM